MTAVMCSEEASARPERIGKYQIVGSLGQGAMGRVYLGEDPHIGRKVAVKVLAGATGDEARSRFLEEARTIGHLSHPDIVTLLEFGFHEGQPFLVMEHLEGESFDRWLARAPTERRVLEVLQALCRAVAYAHGQGVLHRDVKPSNLQVLADGRAKLLDFGIARSGSVALTATGMLMGTPQYLAPEVLEGKGHSRASDVYAVALVAYEALTGASPFAADTLEQCLKRVLIETPKPLEELRPDLPAELARAVMASMAKNPDERPTGVEPLLAALGEALEGAPRALDKPTVRLSEEAVRQAEGGPRPRRRALWLVAGVLALAAVGTAGWLALSSGQAGGPSQQSIADSSPERPFEEEIGGAPAPVSADRDDGAATGPGALSGAGDAERDGAQGEPEPEPAREMARRPPAEVAAGPPARSARSAGDESTARDGQNAEAPPPTDDSGDRQASQQDPPPAATSSETARPEDLLATRDGVPDPAEAGVETTPSEPEPKTSNQVDQGSPAVTEADREPAPPPQEERSTGGQSPVTGPSEDRDTEAEASTTPAQPPAMDLPPAPALERLNPSVIRRGALVTLELQGSGLDDATRVEVRRGSAPMPGIEVRRLRLRDEGRLRVTVYVAPDVPLGLYSLVALDPDGGSSNSLGLEVSL